MSFVLRSIDLLCDRCGHRAPQHDRNGCDDSGCRCSETRLQMVSREVEHGESLMRKDRSLFAVRWLTEVEAEE